MELVREEEGVEEEVVEVIEEDRGSESQKQSLRTFHAVLWPCYLPLGLKMLPG